MKHGEIRWYKFIRPDKKRPVLILTRDSVLEYLDEVTVAPITSTVRDIPSEVFILKGHGMPRDCAINCDHLQTVSKVFIFGMNRQIFCAKWCIRFHKCNFRVDH